MHCDKRLFGALLLVSAVACFAATGCSDITPEPNDEGGQVQSPTTQQNEPMIQREEQQEENRGGGGGSRR